MTKINDPNNLNGKLFGYEIKYTNPVSTNLTSGKYNGNIAEVDWKTSNDGTLRRYDYQYDPLNRLANCIFSEPNSSLPQSSLFDESLEYDLNGNIAKLYRNSKGANGFAQQIDRLTYVYSGNRLTSVTDGSANYKGYPDVSGNNIAYDDNGNMTNQKDKGILKINYNFLNLPNYLEFDKLYYTRGTWQNENVKNFYGSDGSKLSKEHRYSDATGYKKKTTDYLNGFQYETIQSQIVTVLKFVPTSEGYFNFENNKYIYNYTDHLGNVRLSYFKNQNNSIEVLEENNYYPFGLKHEGYNTLTGNPSYKYQYNGKELQQETGQYDYGARFYMPDIGRWGVVDPLAEKYKRMSPYNYVGNNPAIFVDYDGRDFGISMDMKKGTITITGNYYALSRDMKAANGAIGKWNNASGNYSYNYKDANGTERSLKVVFKLTATEVKSTAKADLKNALDTDKSGVSNSFAVDNDRMKSEKPSTDGITINGKKITVRSTSSDDTGGHEIGHTLGLSDDQAISSDIMTHTTESGDTINSTYIQDILSYFDGNTANPNQASDKTKIPGNPNSVVIDTTNSNLKTSKDYENFKKGKVKSTPAE